MRDAAGNKPLKLEIRIPISPTPGFFAQVRLFHFSLRRLGSIYCDARLRVIVGDNCDLDAVIAANPWSHGENIVWDRVPTGLFDVASIWGTANWRLSLDPGDADIIILADADTVLLRNLDPILEELSADRPTVRGHNAHYPPRSTALVQPEQGSGATYCPPMAPAGPNRGAAIRWTWMPTFR